MSEVLNKQWVAQDPWELKKSKEREGQSPTSFSGNLAWDPGSQPCPANSWLIFARHSVSLDFSDGILTWEGWASSALERKGPWNIEV